MLFGSYDQDIRPTPITDDNYITNVTITINYFVLLTLDQQGEQMTFSADVQKSWYDPNLSWDPSAFGNTTRVLTAERSLWRPDIAIVNGAAEEDVIDADSRFSVVFSDGTVQTSVPAVYTTRCSLDLVAFPFDSQQCEVKFGSWVYTVNEIQLIAQEYVLNPGPDYKGNSEWTVENISAYNYLDNDGGMYGELHYVIELKRKSNYYMYVLFLPTFIVSTLAIFGLFTPLNNEGDRAEKASLGLTTLLSLAVMLDIVGQDMPKSAPLPRLGRYVLGEIVICSLGVMASIFLQIAHQRTNTREFIPSETLAKKAFEKFPKTNPSRLGLRVLRSADGHEFQSALNELEVSLRNVCDYIRKTEIREEFYIYWIRFYDVIDLGLLFVFQAANVILTIVIVLM
ncbi:unnamed protein product, partial [Mesorhabditis belari]|uniref:Neurotransmitter-gated ion-channel ligand-binding domain-containing protein n=1 Tax=Mesorhabditis belari TaxID=2138241 RepID=A0AAF3EM62_9BILA